VGPFVAVLCEAPFVLAVVVAAARWVPRVLKLRPDPAPLLLTGWEPSRFNNLQI